MNDECGDKEQPEQANPAVLPDLSMIDTNNFKFQLGTSEGNNPIFLIPAQMNNNQIFLLPCYLPQRQQQSNGEGSQRIEIKLMNLNDFYQIRQQPQEQPQPTKNVFPNPEAELQPPRNINIETGPRQLSVSPRSEEQQPSVQGRTGTESVSEVQRYQLMRTKLERQLKIERYKAKKRNWLKKIEYNCRQKLAKKRLRIKGRFISRNDSERLVALYGQGQVQEDFISIKNNLNISMIPGADVIKVSNTNRRRLKVIKKLIESSKIQLACDRLSSKLRLKQRIFNVSRKITSEMKVLPKVEVFAMT
eukprot:TRINITY_DN5595_c0_g2_i4.p1 TRINITY_DN5595_c0_g2~~TRINITY_DN5595_c0_g2_i4.p1  ORF type:complete len:304 (-),score=78.26 TRINITY_DN5595_c0_g2_i4:144-1055(-)